jgi:hypothetical protein
VQGRRTNEGSIVREDDRGGACPVCGLGFLSQTALLQHLVDQHDRAALLETLGD